MACMTQQRGSGTEEGEKIMKGFSLVPLDVKHGSPSNFDVLSGRCRNVGSIRDIGLVDAFGGLNNLVQPRGNLRWRYPPAKYISSRNRGPIEISVGVLSLDEHGTLQRKTREKT